MKANLVACAQYYDHQMPTFRDLCKKDSSIFGVVCLLNYVLKTVPHMMDFLMVLMIYLNL
jgi:hypothetical protein